MFKVLRTQVDVVLPDGVAVLNADDPLVAAMAALCDGEVIFFGADAALPLIVEHRRKGGRALVVRDERIVLAAGPHEVAAHRLAAVPLHRRDQASTWPACSPPSAPPGRSACRLN